MVLLHKLIRLCSVEYLSKMALLFVWQAKWCVMLVLGKCHLSVFKTVVLYFL